MPYPKTMAVEITEDTYPIAVACLAAGFAVTPFSKLEGCYLVINEISAEYFKENGRRPVLTISNSWMTKELFEESYRWTTPGRKGSNFAPVEPIG